MAAKPGVTGFGEQAMAWPLASQGAKPSFDLLWGALAGRVHVAEGTDLAAPTGEAWEAEGGPA